MSRPSSRRPGEEGRHAVPPAGSLVVPLVVVEGPPEAYEAAIGELRAEGWVVTAGFATSGIRDRRSVRTGVVHGQRDAEAALLAALEGSGVVVHALGQRPVIDRLVDDLRRLGPVIHRVGPAAPTEDLSPDAMAILGLLAEGHSLGEAASILGLARRTADRRLGDARKALGVERTTEAIARAAKLGWLRSTPAP